MKRIFGIVLLAAATVFLPSSAAIDKQATAFATVSPTENIEQLLIQLEREGADATVKGDVAGVGRLLADDWVGIFSDGQADRR